MTQARGSALHATLNFLAADVGMETLRRIIQHLPAEHRERIETAAPVDEVPFEVLLALWRAADQVLQPDDPTWVERAGADSIGSLGMRRYGGILRKPSPLDFLTQRVSLFRLYYAPGDMQVVAQEPGRAVLRLTDWDTPDPLFCRRQTGGLQRAVELAGGANPAARHVRCVVEGDAFCEWELTWT